MVADDTQKLKIWRHMHGKDQFSAACVQQFYFSNVTWSNCILDTHHMNHVFITLNFEQTEVIQKQIELINPDKLLCLEADGPSRKRKNHSSTETSPNLPKRKRRKENHVSKLRARYIAKRAERRRKMMTLGYPVDSADESDARKQDYDQRQQFAAQKQKSESDNLPSSSNKNENKPPDLRKIPLRNILKF